MDMRFSQDYIVKSQPKVSGSRESLILKATFLPRNLFHSVGDLIFMQGEMLFLILLFLPTVLALVAWVLKHSITIDGAENAPSNYWGAYNESTPVVYTRLRLPENLHDTEEHTSHAHTIGVHP